MSKIQTDETGESSTSSSQQTQCPFPADDQSSSDGEQPEIVIETSSSSSDLECLPQDENDLHTPSPRKTKNIQQQNARSLLRAFLAKPSGAEQSDHNGSVDVMQAGTSSQGNYMSYYDLEGKHASMSSNKRKRLSLKRQTDLNNSIVCHESVKVKTETEIVIGDTYTSESDFKDPSYSRSPSLSLKKSPVFQTDADETKEDSQLTIPETDLSGNDDNFPEFQHTEGKKFKSGHNKRTGNLNNGGALKQTKKKTVRSRVQLFAEASSSRRESESDSEFDAFQSTPNSLIKIRRKHHKKVKSTDRDKLRKSPEGEFLDRHHMAQTSERMIKSAVSKEESSDSDSILHSRPMDWSSTYDTKKQVSVEKQAPLPKQETDESSDSESILSTQPSQSMKKIMVQAKQAQCCSRTKGCDKKEQPEQDHQVRLQNKYEQEAKATAFQPSISLKGETDTSQIVSYTTTYSNTTNKILDSSRNNKNTAINLTAKCKHKNVKDLKEETLSSNKRAVNTNIQSPTENRLLSNTDNKTQTPERGNNISSFREMTDTSVLHSSYQEPPAKTSENKAKMILESLRNKSKTTTGLLENAQHSKEETPKGKIAVDKSVSNTRSPREDRLFSNPGNKTPILERNNSISSSSPSVAQSPAPSQHESHADTSYSNTKRIFESLVKKKKVMADMMTRVKNEKLSKEVDEKCDGKMGDESDQHSASVEEKSFYSNLEKVRPSLEKSNPLASNGESTSDSQTTIPVVDGDADNGLLLNDLPELSKPYSLSNASDSTIVYYNTSTNNDKKQISFIENSVDSYDGSDSSSLSKCNCDFPALKKYKSRSLSLEVPFQDDPLRQLAQVFDKECNPSDQSLTHRSSSTSLPMPALEKRPTDNLAESYSCDDSSPPLLSQYPIPSSHFSPSHDVCAESSTLKAKTQSDLGNSIESSESMFSQTDSNPAETFPQNNISVILHMLDEEENEGGQKMSQFTTIGKVISSRANLEQRTKVETKISKKNHKEIGPSESGSGFSGECRQGRPSSSFCTADVSVGQGSNLAEVKTEPVISNQPDVFYSEIDDVVHVFDSDDEEMFLSQSVLRNPTGQDSNSSASEDRISRNDDNDDEASMQSDNAVSDEDTFAQGSPGPDLKYVEDGAHLVTPANCEENRSPESGQSEDEIGRTYSSDEEGYDGNKYDHPRKITAVFDENTPVPLDSDNDSNDLYGLMTQIDTVYDDDDDFDLFQTQEDNDISNNDGIDEARINNQDDFERSKKHERDLESFKKDRHAEFSTHLKRSTDNPDTVSYTETALDCSHSDQTNQRQSTSMHSREGFGGNELYDASTQTASVSSKTKSADFNSDDDDDFYKIITQIDSLCQDNDDFNKDSWPQDSDQVDELDECAKAKGEIEARVKANDKDLRNISKVASVDFGSDLSKPAKGEEKLHIEGASELDTENGDSGLDNDWKFEMATQVDDSPATQMSVSKPNIVILDEKDTEGSPPKNISIPRSDENNGTDTDIDDDSNPYSVETLIDSPPSAQEIEEDPFSVETQVDFDIVKGDSVDPYQMQTLVDFSSPTQDPYKMETLEDSAVEGDTDPYSLETLEDNPSTTADYHEINYIRSPAKSTRDVPNIFCVATQEFPSVSGISEHEAYDMATLEFPPNTGSHIPVEPSTTPSISKFKSVDRVVKKINVIACKTRTSDAPAQECPSSSKVDFASSDSVENGNAKTASEDKTAQPEHMETASPHADTHHRIKSDLASVCNSTDSKSNVTLCVIPENCESRSRDSDMHKKEKQKKPPSCLPNDYRLLERYLDSNSFLLIEESNQQEFTRKKTTAEDKLKGSGSSSISSTSKSAENKNNSGTSYKTAVIVSNDSAPTPGKHATKRPVAEADVVRTKKPRLQMNDKKHSENQTHLKRLSSTKEVQNRKKKSQETKSAVPVGSQWLSIAKKSSPHKNKTSHRLSKPSKSKKPGSKSAVANDELRRNFQKLRQKLKERQDAKLTSGPVRDWRKSSSHLETKAHSDDDVEMPSTQDMMDYRLPILEAKLPVSKKHFALGLPSQGRLASEEQSRSSIENENDAFPISHKPANMTSMSNTKSHNRAKPATESAPLPPVPLFTSSDHPNTTSPQYLEQDKAISPVSKDWHSRTSLDKISHPKPVVNNQQESPSSTASICKAAVTNVSESVTSNAAICVSVLPLTTVTPCTSAVVIHSPITTSCHLPVVTRSSQETAPKLLSTPSSVPSNPVMHIPKTSHNLLPSSSALAPHATNPATKGTRPGQPKGILKENRAPPPEQLQKLRPAVNFSESSNRIHPIERRVTGPIMYPKTPHPMQASVEKPEAILHFLHVVLNWRPEWLKEEEKIKKVKNQLPPLFSGAKRPESECSQLRMYYTDLKEYLDITTNLLVLEFWEMILRDWKMMPSQNLMKFDVQMVAVPKHSSEEVRKYGLLNVAVTGVVAERDRARLPSKRDFLILNVWGRSKMDASSQDPSWFQQFAYVKSINVSNRPVNKKQFLAHRKLFESLPAMKNLPENLLTFHMDLGIRYRRLLLDNKLLNFKKISTLKMILRQVGALDELPHSHLYKQLLSPSPHNTVFYHQFHPVTASPVLNAEQASAVTYIRRAVLGPPHDQKVFLLQGPPGTGKSHTILNLIQQIIECSKYRAQICLATPSNAAVDEVAKRVIKISGRLKAKGAKPISLVRVGNPNSVHQDLIKFTLEELVKETKIKDAAPESVKKELNSHRVEMSNLQKLLSDRNLDRAQRVVKEGKLKDLQKQIEKLKREIEPKKCSAYEQYRIECQIIDSAHVICGTLSSFGHDGIREILLRKKDKPRQPFTCLIIDEATQAIEVDCLIPLQYKMTKLILVGDQEQLPATVLSQTASEKLLNRSLFERLCLRFREFHQQDQSQVPPVMMLTRQYRMHEEILSLPNSFFYDKKLVTDQSVLERNQSVAPYLVFNIQESRETRDGTYRSVSNEDEAFCTAELCSQVVSVLNKSFESPHKRIGVICPYVDQKRAIRWQLRNRDRNLGDIEVNTVDGFQGQERDVIIMSCVRAQSSPAGIGFVADRKRMNVALTRAKHALYVIGHFDTLSTDELWGELYRNAQDRKLLVNVRQTSDFSKIAAKCIHQVPYSHRSASARGQRP